MLQWNSLVSLFLWLSNATLEPRGQRQADSAGRRVFLLLLLNRAGALYLIRFFRLFSAVCPRGLWCLRITAKHSLVAQM